MVTQVKEHKRGNTLDLLIQIPSEFIDGYFVDWTHSAQARTSGDLLVANLVTSWVDPLTTRYLNVKCLDTKAWPVGKVEFDVRFVRTSDNHTISTSTGIIYVVKDITHV